ncbi:MAG: toprim domain-containing protein [Candidatus Woesearchaeota archaeon]
MNTRRDITNNQLKKTQKKGQSLTLAESARLQTTRYDEQIERILEQIQRIEEEGIIIVEGKNDVAALRKAGIKAYAITTNHELFVERLYRMHARQGVGAMKRKVLLLTDFDRHGEKIRKSLVPILARYGFIEQKALRYQIKKVFAISHIESWKASFAYRNCCTCVGFCTCDF